MKACPCCGGKPLLTWWGGLFKPFYDVHCDDCGLSTAACKSRKKAVEMWDRRVRKPECTSIVRCGECIHYVMPEGNVATRHCEILETYNEEITDHNICENDFCSYGEADRNEGRIRNRETMTPLWIDVKERLPKPDQDVLLIAHGWSDRVFYIGCLRHVNAEKSPLLGIVSEESEWSIYGWSYLKQPRVTYWMPLPEFPKGAKVND